MKKTLLFVVLLMAFSIHGLRSQTLTLYSKYGEITPDASVGYNGLPGDPEILCELYVKNNSNETQSVLMKKVIIDTVTGSINSFCWGTNCFPPFVYVSPEAVDIPAGATDSISFSAHYEPLGNIGTSIIRYVFFLRNTPSDTASTRVYFMAFPAGVDSKSNVAQLGSVYPNPADDHCTVKFNFPEGNATLLVRDILGNIKFQEEISGSGSKNISTADFSNGMYFCTLQINGKSGATKKILVQH